VDVSTLSDEDLVRAAAAGGADARGELFHRHWRAVWKRAYLVTGRPEAADDVTQDAFERAFRSLGTFERGAPFAPWIQRIAINRAIDLLRAERRLAPLEAAPDRGEWDALPGGDRELQAAVAGLPAERRAVVILRFWADLRGPEIAELLDLPVGTVHSRLSRALDDLRSELEEGRR
jgi:RNA polymerase sigma-70 factor (ECF subfamily)